MMFSNRKNSFKKSEIPFTSAELNSKKFELLSALADAYSRNADPLLRSQKAIRKNPSPPDLPPEVLPLATALRDKWQTIYNASESASAAKAATEARLRAARQRLQPAHYQTLLTIAQRYPDQPKKLPL